MKANNLEGKDILTLEELSSDNIDAIIEAARRYKAERRTGITMSDVLGGKSIALLFEKPSTRTRASFEVAASELGGHSVYMNFSETQISRGEPIKDVARVLSRYAHCIVARVYKHSVLEELSKYSDKPIINALSDDFHPTQLLADLMTILEAKGRIKGTSVAFVGDCSWNMSNTWLYAAARTGIDLRLACPDPLKPKDKLLQRAMNMATETGGNIRVFKTPQEAVRASDVVYTDVWTSMGQESEREKMHALLSGYQVNERLMSLAKSNAIFMHPLPAHRGEEVEEAVLEGPKSVVFEQSENKLHIAKGLLHLLLPFR